LIYALAYREPIPANVSVLIFVIYIIFIDNQLHRVLLFSIVFIFKLNKKMNTDERKITTEITTDEYLMLKEIRIFSGNPNELTCPCCGAKDKIYKRQFDNTYVDFLISLVHLFKNEFKGQNSIHYSKVIEKCQNEFNRRITDYALIEKWHLLDNENGFIKLSPNGFKFMLNEISIPEILYIRNNVIIKESANRVFIKDFLTDEKNNL
jgi:hypothetical protein